MTKSELRKVYLGKVTAIPPSGRDAASRSIATNFFLHFHLAAIKTLHSFLPIEKFNEVDTNQIIHGVWKRHPQVRVVVPRVNFEAGEMESIPYTAESETTHNRWLIPEPLEGEAVGPAAIDMVLVPGLCFDVSMHRVGYGKGFYDKFLRQVRPDCIKVGLSYFPPVDGIDDLHDGDVKLDTVLTPDSFVTAQK